MYPKLISEFSRRDRIITINPVCLLLGNLNMNVYPFLLTNKYFWYYVLCFLQVDIYLRISIATSQWYRYLKDSCWALLIVNSQITSDIWILQLNKYICLQLSNSFYNKNIFHTTRCMFSVISVCWCLGSQPCEVNDMLKYPRERLVKHGCCLFWHLTGFFLYECVIQSMVLCCQIFKELNMFIYLYLSIRHTVYCECFQCMLDF